MIAVGKNELICDLAETYGILDYKALPVKLLATLSVGLRENSRIKMKMTDAKANQTDMMMAGIIDRLSLLVWASTKDGMEGKNRPQLLLDELFGEHIEGNNKSKGYSTPEEFEKAKMEFLKGGK